jgi:hypothetical protein
MLLEPADELLDPVERLAPEPESVDDDANELMPRLTRWEVGKDKNARVLRAA